MLDYWDTTKQMSLWTVTALTAGHQLALCRWTEMLPHIISVQSFSSLNKHCGKQLQLWPITTNRHNHVKRVFEILRSSAMSLWAWTVTSRNVEVKAHRACARCFTRESQRWGFSHFTHKCICCESFSSFMKFLSSLNKGFPATTAHLLHSARKKMKSFISNRVSSKNKKTCVLSSGRSFALVYKCSALSTFAKISHFIKTRGYLEAKYKPYFPSWKTNKSSERLKLCAWNPLWYFSDHQCQSFILKLEKQHHQKLFDPASSQMMVIL